MSCGTRIRTKRHEKTFLHAPACSISTGIPFLVVLILPAWEDSPWRKHSILSHPNIITTTVHLNNFNQLEFILDNKQLDINLGISLLRAANCPIDMIVIANKEKKNYLHPTRLQHILIPGILQACQDTTKTISFFPSRPHKYAH